MLTAQAGKDILFVIQLPNVRDMESRVVARVAAFPAAGVGIGIIIPGPRV
jgi:hypothetical protein